MNHETVSSVPQADVQGEARWKGANLPRLAATIFAAGWTPVLLYSAVVPRDANPVGLGLFAFSATVVALGLGTISLANALFGRGR